MDTSAIEKLLQESIGLNVSSIGTNTLKSAIKRRLTSLNLDHESYSKLLQTSKVEINELIEEVTVNETWFFRDQKPFLAVVDFAKALRAQNFPAKIQVLSLPCSTGEEPYSIAISLLEAGFAEYSFHIDAVDINSKVINRAESGVYNKNSFRGSDKYYTEKYFKKSGKHYALRNKFKNTVTFQKGNLINFTPVEPSRQYEIIFCRNLLIYLDKETQKNVIVTLDNLLAPKGILFIGHAEAGVFSNSQFTASPYPKSFSLVRKADFPGTLPQLQPPPEDAVHEKNRLSVSKKKVEPDEEKKLQKNIFEVDELIEAKYFLDKNEHQLAIKLCENHIKRYGPTSHSLYLLGSAYHKERNYQKAIEMLKKSIYLNPENLKALNLLAAAYMNISDNDKTAKTHKRIERVQSRLGTKRSS